jgi:hypothetical protein
MTSAALFPWVRVVAEGWETQARVVERSSVTVSLAIPFDTAEIRIASPVTVRSPEETVCGLVVRTWRAWQGGEGGVVVMILGREAAAQRP